MSDSHLQSGFREQINRNQSRPQWSYLVWAKPFHILINQITYSWSHQLQVRSRLAQFNWANLCSDVLRVPSRSRICRTWLVTRVCWLKTIKLCCCRHPASPATCRKSPRNLQLPANEILWLSTSSQWNPPFVLIVEKVLSQPIRLICSYRTSQWLWFFKPANQWACWLLTS